MFAADGLKCYFMCGQLWLAMRKVQKQTVTCSNSNLVKHSTLFILWKCLRFKISKSFPLRSEVCFYTIIIIMMNEQSNWQPVIIGKKLTPVRALCCCSLLQQYQAQFSHMGTILMRYVNNMLAVCESRGEATETSQVGSTAAVYKV